MNTNNFLNIVLLEPEIPQNTGNISRTCAASGISLHLIEPFGFELSDRTLKRAGLDYWQYLDVHYYKNIEDFYTRNPDATCYYFTTKSSRPYTDVDCTTGQVYFFFGRETKGLPEPLLEQNKSHCVTIPMLEEVRSLNLSNAVAIAAYEALRQRNFPNLLHKGAEFLD